MTNSWKTIERKRNVVTRATGCLVFCFMMPLFILFTSQTSAFNKEDLVKSLKSDDTDGLLNVLVKLDELDNSQLTTIEHLNELLIPMIKIAKDNETDEILIFAKSLQRKLGTFRNVKNTKYFQK